MSTSWRKGFFCSLALWGSLAMFHASAVGAKAPPHDLDRDGVADRLDLCPSTERGAKIVAHGCSALDVALSSQALVDFSLGELAEQQSSLARDLTLAPAVERLMAVSSSLSRAAHSMRRGNVCAAADLAEAAMADLQATREEVRAAAAGNALVASVEAAAKGEEPALAAALLPSLVAQPAFDRAEVLASLYRAACSEVVGKFRAHGIVSEVRDDLRIFRIGRRVGEGQPIGLAEGNYRTGPIEQIEIEARGIEFADGSRLATWIKVPEPQVEPVKTQQCLNLRVAPFQEFPPYSPVVWSWTSFPIEGYQNTFGVADLERNQRFAAVDVNCPTTSGFSILSHSMRIMITQGGNTWMIASNLKKTDPPVELPTGFLDNTLGQVAATVYRTACLGTLCSTTTLGTHTVSIVVRPFGTYATAVYDKTLFNVAGNGNVGDYERATVTGFNLSIIGNGNNPSLLARGYHAPLGSNPDSSISLLNEGLPFAIWDYDLAFDDEMYNDEAYGFDKIAEFNRTGVDHPAGLVWPWVRGNRNGFDFAYGVKLPIVVRDRITDCAGSLDSFYETPFSLSDFGLLAVSKGNSDDPGSAHGGTSGFALDFTAPPGWQVRAARPGNVYLMDASHAANITEPTAGGNYLVVQHQDGTFGLYWNIAQNSLAANLFLGKRVNLNFPMAAFGSGPLHFEAGNKCHPVACSATSGYASVKALYRTTTSTIAVPFWNPTDKTCYVPKSGDHF